MTRVRLLLAVLLGLAWLPHAQAGSLEARFNPVPNGALVTTDGPFAETTEQLGGFYLIEARDLNEAIQVASRIPSARIGSVEVRPVVDFGS